MGRSSNVEQLDIEINLITESVHRGISALSKETMDYEQLVQQAGTGIQAMMDKTGMSATAAIAKIQELNKNIITMRNIAEKNDIPTSGMPNAINPTLLTAALRDSETLRKSVDASNAAEISAENKLDALRQKREASDEKAVASMVERVSQKRAEAEVDANDLAYEKMKTLELEKQAAASSAASLAERAAVPGGGLIERTAGQFGMYDTGEGVMQFREAIGPLPAQIGQVGESAGRAAQGFNVLRTAMGFLTAMALSAIATALTQMFQKIVDSASQAEQAMINLGIAERAMSEAGTDITPKQLTDISDKIATTYKSISQIDSQKMISQLAVMTKDLGLTADQYEKLGLTIVQVSQRTSKTVEDATNQVVNGLTKSGRGWADLGITVNAGIIKQRAIADELVESEAAYDALTATQKEHINTLALINIAYEKNKENAKDQAKYDNSLAGSKKALAAAWDDFTAALGKLTAPTTIQFIQQLTEVLKTMNKGLKENAATLQEVSALFTAMSKVYGVLKALGNGSIFEGLVNAGTMQVDLASMFKDSYNQAKDYYKNLKAPEDNPTAKIGTDVEVDTQAVKDAFEKLRQDIIDEKDKLEQDKFEAKIDLQVKLEDIDINYARKVEDIITKTNRSIEDANRDYGNKVAQINTDTNNKLSEAQAKYRADDQKAEEEYQNKLLKLREDYLMSLEDALHERDARQILRLMKKYELDKTQAARDHAADQRQRAADFQNEIKSIQNEKAQRLAEAKNEHAQKLADIQAAKQRELEDAALWRKREQADAQRDYQRKLQDLNRHYQQRILQLAAALRNELTLTASQAAALQKMLLGNVDAYRQYLLTLVAATNGAIQGMTPGQTDLGASVTGNGGNTRLGTGVVDTVAGNTGATVATTGVAPSLLNGATTTPKSGTNPLGVSVTGNGGWPFAEGGTLIADRPTKAIFGEKGAEAVSIMPLGRTGKNINKVFGNLGALGTGGGNVTINLDLSPDLEGRIVSSTLDEAANIIMGSRRLK